VDAPAVHSCVMSEEKRLGTVISLGMFKFSDASQLPEITDLVWDDSFSTSSPKTDCKVYLRGERMPLLPHESVYILQDLPSQHLPSKSEARKRGLKFCDDGGDLRRKKTEC
jgi:hypothetical protein